MKAHCCIAAPLPDSEPFEEFIHSFIHSFIYSLLPNWHIHKIQQYKSNTQKLNVFEYNVVRESR